MGNKIPRRLKRLRTSIKYYRKKRDDVRCAFFLEKKDLFLGRESPNQLLPFQLALSLQSSQAVSEFVS